MTSTVRRATALALVGTVALVVPLVGQVDEPAVATLSSIVPFVLITAVALTAKSESIVFRLFARPGDRRDGRLYSLAGFALAAAGVAVLTVEFGMPDYVYVATLFVILYGNLGGQIVRLWTHKPVTATAGFVTAGFLSAFAAQLFTLGLTDTAVGWQTGMFLAASGGLLAALLRQSLFKRDDALVLVSVAVSLWLLSDLSVKISTTRIAVALVVTAVLGYASFTLETASLPGMLTGILLGLLTIVLGDYGWFAMLIAFFGIGGLASKFRYDQKRRRGIAEGNEGARGTGNVLANSLVALIAVVAAAGSPDLGISETVFFYAFAGAVAAALADTLSSEIGGLYDDPRLLTTFERVEPGTDGAVTWQGELMGIAGATTIAAIGYGAFTGIDLAGAAAILIAGVVGMTVDSLLGATIEGWLCGNKGVNFLATFVAAMTGGVLALELGLSV